ncbi:dimethyladenosine transferase [Sinobacterium caligoides]|uniref:Ribosomal RNA small subunit methyltransferase A n=1 Tax=Sinobacterium caligoides TaxID=933926 RepID=A0A3N2DP12_9GAMM|nr:16S rRNA (adenine(1518)-N(6)/adenine(1519)-N(6))-dimethyltransferase RsmA [Sinobacterium caligoides]ROS01548.1 dimethyladenosine transferase [Sinobacterium caligoides]
MSKSDKPNYGHQAKKRFGQNFLSDPSIINNIIASIRPKTDQHLVEIGPGQGALTGSLLDSGARLDVIELDNDLLPILKLHFGLKENFTLHHADALRFDFNALVDDEKDLRVVGNLPYNISTPLIFHLLQHCHNITDMHFMLQYEVVKRLAASPDSKAFGRLTVMTQYYCDVEQLFIVPPGAFRPAPKVDSAIVRLVPHKQLPYPAHDVKLLEHVVGTAFQQRRKTLRNTLKKLCSEAFIVAQGIDPSDRPENLSLKEYVILANAIFEARKNDEDVFA